MALALSRSSITPSSRPRGCRRGRPLQVLNFSLQVSQVYLLQAVSLRHLPFCLRVCVLVLCRNAFVPRFPLTLHACVLGLNYFLMCSSSFSLFCCACFTSPAPIFVFLSSRGSLKGCVIPGSDLAFLRTAPIYFPFVILCVLCCFAPQGLVIYVLFIHALFWVYSIFVPDPRGFTR